VKGFLVEEFVFIDTEDGVRGGIPAPAEGVLYLAEAEVVAVARHAGRTDVFPVEDFRVTLPDHLLPPWAKIAE
jgi:hypothetical protein